MKRDKINFNRCVKRMTVLDTCSKYREVFVNWRVNQRKPIVDIVDTAVDGQSSWNRDMVPEKWSG